MNPVSPGTLLNIIFVLSIVILILCFECYRQQKKTAKHKAEYLSGAVADNTLLKAYEEEIARLLDDLSRISVTMTESGDVLRQSSNRLGVAYKEVEDMSQVLVYVLKMFEVPDSMYETIAAKTTEAFAAEIKLAVERKT